METLLSTGKNEVIKTLINAGAELNLKNCDGETAVHYAAEKGHNEVATTLFLFGADMSIQNKDWETPPHHPIVRFR